MPPPRLTRLITALHDVLVSLSELLCYVVMIFNQLLHGSILAMPYPFSVFLWAMLSVPRPSTVYWTTMIFYTEVRKRTISFYSMHSSAFCIIICFRDCTWNRGTISVSQRALKKVDPYTKSVVKSIYLFSKCKYPLLYYRGHYFPDTPVKMPRWLVVMFTVFSQVFEITVKDNN